MSHEVILTIKYQVPTRHSPGSSHWQFVLHRHKPRTGTALPSKDDWKSECQNNYPHFLNSRSQNYDLMQFRHTSHHIHAESNFVEVRYIKFCIKSFVEDRSIKKLAKGPKVSKTRGAARQRFEMPASVGGWQVANKTAGNKNSGREAGSDPEKGEFEERHLTWLWRRAQLPVAMTITPWVRIYSAQAHDIIRKLWKVAKCEWWGDLKR